MRLTLAIVLAATALAVPARADIPPRPRPNPPRPVPVRPVVPPAATDAKFVVEADEKAKGPKLIVPLNLTNPRPRFQPAPGAPAGKEPLALAHPADDAPAEAPWNPNHLMIAGLALTLALALAGVWLARRPGRNRGLILALAAGATLAAGTVVWANAPVPPPPPASPAPPAVLPVAFDGNVTLELAPAGDTIRLVLDKETYEKMKKEPKVPEKK
jgi:hypothetical protein